MSGFAFGGNYGTGEAGLRLAVIMGRGNRASFGVRGLTEMVLESVAVGRRCRWGRWCRCDVGGRCRWWICGDSAREGGGYDGARDVGGGGADGGDGARWLRCIGVVFFL